MNNICQGTLLNFDKKEFFITKDKKKNNEDYELKADEKLTAKKTIKESIRSSTTQEKGMNIDILLIYLLPYNQRYVRIFGADFVKKNKDKCYFMLYDSVKNLVYDYDLCDVIEILAIPSIKYNSETFQVFLVQTDYFTDLSFMFAGCDYLLCSNEISKLKTEKVTSISSMFLQCTFLEKLGDIGDLNTSQVTEMNSTFGC
jgi:hypothetical protein